MLLKKRLQEKIKIQEIQQSHNKSKLEDFQSFRKKQNMITRFLIKEKVDKNYYRLQKRKQVKRNYNHLKEKIGNKKISKKYSHINKNKQLRNIIM